MINEFSLIQQFPSHLTCGDVGILNNCWIAASKALSGFRQGRPGNTSLFITHW